MSESAPTSRRPLVKRLGITVVTVGALLAGGTAALEHEERQLVFRVVHDAASWYSGLPDGVQEFDLPVTRAADAQHIHAWWWPAANPHAPAVLYLHGARWNLTGQVFRLEQLREFGFSVLAIDYRGFGKSDGELPSEQTVYEDGHAAWEWLAKQQPDPAKRFIYGHSLGGAVAVDLAASLSRDSDRSLPDAASNGSGSEVTTPVNKTRRQGSPAAGLIIESTFTTLADVAKEFSYPWLPIGLLLSQKFDSMSKMAEVKMPVLVVHGASDRYIPSRFSQALYAAASGPKRLLLVEGATHNNSMLAGAEEYRRALADLFGLGAQAAARVGARGAIRRGHAKG